jgi:hypothetical protein
MPVIPVLRQEDLEFELSLGYIVNSRPALAEPLLAREVLTKKKKKEKKEKPQTYKPYYLHLEEIEMPVFSCSTG